MKLLIANHHLDQLAGSELHTLDLCRGFRRAGHEVVVFAPVLGSVANVLKEEGFPVLSMPNLGSLREKTFDLVYLHHSTCEVLLGPIFAGQVPIVRGFLGIFPPLEHPIGGGFLSAAIYKSEGGRHFFAKYHTRIPSLIAYNVYDDRRVYLGAALGEPRPTKPNFAVVSNHLDTNLEGLLTRAAEKGLCSFTHFGLPHNSILVTAKLLVPFDAVITIGRTVVLCAALGKPVYVCDIHGADNWLERWNFDGSRRHGFSGRLLTISDWDFVESQLLDTTYWPTTDDLAWLCEQAARDHALSRRVEQLELFFADLIENASLPAPAPEGYRAILQFVEEEELRLQELEKTLEKMQKQERERERAGRFEEEPRAERSKGFWQRLFG